MPFYYHPRAIIGNGYEQRMIPVSRMIQQTKTQVLNNRKQKSIPRGNQAFLQPCHLTLAIREDHPPPQPIFLKEARHGIEHTPKRPSQSNENRETTSINAGTGLKNPAAARAYNLAFVVIRSVQKSASLDTFPYIIFGVC